MEERTYTWDIPLFVTRGYATLDGDDFYKKGGKEILLDKTSKEFKRIGIKDDAPLWAQDEYENWLKYRAADR